MDAATTFPIAARLAATIPVPLDDSVALLELGSLRILGTKPMTFMYEAIASRT